jgi:signal transduction histidine kinase/ActR/RegA family two-component response regulator
VVSVLHLILPDRGLVPMEYHGGVFSVVLLTTALNITAKVRLLLTEAEPRDRRLAEATAEAEAANAAKSEFLAHMSHELRTPVAGIIGLSDVLLMGGLAAAPAQLVGQSKSSAEHLLRVVNGLLDLSKLAAGAMPLNIEPFDLASCARNAVTMVEPRARSKGLALDLALEQPSGRWRSGDGFRLTQVLVNLIGNAVKFTDEGSVTVRLTEDTRPEWVVIEVSDTGPGIPPGQLESVFAPFQQGDSSTQKQRSGTGLGLAISRSLVELAGGTISCASSEGHGTTFTVRLPLPIEAPPVAPVLPHGQPVPPPGSATIAGMQVLVAEDNPVNQTVIQAQLGHLEVEATVVGNGQLALDALQNGSFDLVIMDMQMPIMDGLEATRRLRANGNTIAVCGLTANARAEDLARCREAGMDLALAKPIDLIQLRMVLAAVRSGRASELRLVQ